MRYISNPLPYVSTATHLGHGFHESGDMEHDAKVKRAIYIRQSMEIREQFSFVYPREQLAAIKLYAASFYGSNIGYLGGHQASQVFSSWRVSVQDCWAVQQSTHHIVVDNLLSEQKTYVLLHYVLRTRPPPQGGTSHSWRRRQDWIVCVPPRQIERRS